MLSYRKFLILLALAGAVLSKDLVAMESSVEVKEADVEVREADEQKRGSCIQEECPEECPIEERSILVAQRRGGRRPRRNAISQADAAKYDELLATLGRLKRAHDSERADEVSAALQDVSLNSGE